MHSVEWNTFSSFLFFFPSYYLTDLIPSHGATGPFSSLFKELHPDSKVVPSLPCLRPATVWNALDNEGKLHEMGWKNRLVSLAFGVVLSRQWQWRWEMANYSWCRRWLFACLAFQRHAHSSLCLKVGTQVAEKSHEAFGLVPHCGSIQWTQWELKEYSWGVLHYTRDGEQERTRSCVELITKMNWEWTEYLS